jgi:pyrroline-5-carboxylate reductase
MGEAIARGLAQVAGAPDVRVVSVRKASSVAAVAERLAVEVTTSNAEAARKADLVLLAVKPQVARSVLEGPGVTEALQGKLLISICAGVSTGQLAQWAPGAAVVRAMPNTPCLIGEGMTVLSPGPSADEEHLELATSVFRAVGRVRVLDEGHLDAVTGLSGSGPAFACVILEALADGGVRMGLPRDVAVELAAQTFQGAARMVLETGKHPAALKDEVTTPAGCTIAGLLTMEDGRIRSILARTIEEAAQVASTLGGPR